MSDELQLRRDFAIALARQSGQTVKVLRPGLAASFDRAVWHRRQIRKETNCYGYALGSPEIGLGVPGHLLHPDVHDLPPRRLTVDYLRALLLQDGLEELTRTEALRPGSGAIALAVAPAIPSSPNGDFHFWRQEDSGLWTHKPSGGSVSALDKADALITDPEAANRGPYRKFGGFHKIPADGVPFVPKLDLADVALASTRYRP